MSADKSNNIKKKNNLMIILCICFLLLAIVYSIYYKYQQGKIVLNEIEGFSIEAKSENLTLIGVKWLDAYNEQFYQRYLPKNKKLIEHSIDDIYVLEPNIIQIDFTVRPKLLNEGTTMMWDGIIEDHKIKCQWVLYFEKEITDQGTIVYTVSKKQRPSAYDLEKYQTSGEKEIDEYEQEYVNEIPFEEKQYTYKIEDNNCFVSYDGGSTWSLVPIELETLVEVGDGNSYYNQLQEGSFIISPEKTAFVFGGTRETNLSIIYTDDIGDTWNTSIISEQISSNRIKFCSFPSNNIGYVIATTDRTMSQEAQTIFKTTDGGKTWVEIGYGPSTWTLYSSNFIDENIGFMSYPKVEGAETNFYRTIDGGKSFEPIKLPVYMEEWMGLTYEPFIQPEAPYLENGTLYILVNQGAQGDFKGGTLKAKYKSDDLGETWIFEELVEPQIRTIG